MRFEPQILACARAMVVLCLGTTIAAVPAAIAGYLAVDLPIRAATTTAATPDPGVDDHPLAKYRALRDRAGLTTPERAPAPPSKTRIDRQREYAHTLAVIASIIFAATVMWSFSLATAAWSSRGQIPHA